MKNNAINRVKEDGCMKYGENGEMKGRCATSVKFLDAK